MKLSLDIETNCIEKNGKTEFGRKSFEMIFEWLEWHVTKFRGTFT